MKGLNLEFIKYQVNNVPFSAPKHSHTCSELVYYISGYGFTNLGDCCYSYAPNTFALISPELFHDEVARTNTQLLFIGFTCYDETLNFTPGIYHDFNDNDVYRKLLEMKYEFDKKKPYYSTMLNNITHNILINVMRECFKYQNRAEDYCVVYIKKYIDEHFTEKINPIELARMSGYSYDWFRHLFKKISGITISQYITNRRLKHAIILLTDTNKTVTAIANECLFSSTSQFITMFKRFKRMTPGEYRQSLKDKSKVNLLNK